MDATATRAASAYAQAIDRARTGAMGGPDEASAATAPGQSFGAMLGEQVQGAIDTGKVAEQQSLKAAQGKADLVDVVTAVNNAEVALQTVVAVRDRMVQAYQEIMRMPI
jgi:flagellar hook-basal body complex protein FliE